MTVPWWIKAGSIMAAISDVSKNKVPINLQDALLGFKKAQMYVTEKDLLEQELASIA